MLYELKYHAGKQKKQTKPGFSFRILVAGWRCNVTKHLHVWIIKRPRLPNISRRIQSTKQRILQSLMPNEHSEQTTVMTQRKLAF